MDQGDLASDIMVDLGRVVMRCGTPAQQCAFVHVATNSLQYHWTTDDDDVSAVRQLQCDQCPAAHLSIAHLASACDGVSSRRYHRRLHRAIVALLGEFDAARDWLRDNGLLTLAALLLVMFPPPMTAAALAPGIRHHTSLVMIGAFTTSESNADAKRIGFDRSADGRTAMDRLRLTCIDLIAALYSELKDTG